MSDVAAATQKFTFGVFLSNLFKLIPLELTLVYSLVKTAIPANAEPTWVWILLGIFLAIVPVYLIFAAKIKSPVQIILNTLAMAAYMIALGIPLGSLAGAFSIPTWFVNAIMAVVLLLPPILSGTRLDTKDIPAVAVAKRFTK